MKIEIPELIRTYTHIHHTDLVLIKLNNGQKNGQ